ncbi:unnamed protein product [Calypogeia fissa]
MAGRSLLSCISHSLRRSQQKIPRLSDQPPFHPLLSQIGCCSVSGNHFSQLGGLDHIESVNRSVTSIRTVRCVSNSLFTFAATDVGCRSLLSLNRRELGSPVRTLGQTGSYSSSAVAIEEDDTMRLSAEIGYEVLGQYGPGSPRIKPRAAFAVVQVGSHQFKVTPGDMIYTEKLKYADINDKLLLNKVLLLGSLNQTIIGRPIIPDAGVLAAVEEIALDAKVIVFKKKRRKNYRRTNGHRQELTRLRILQIEGIQASASGLENSEQLGENRV